MRLFLFSSRVREMACWDMLNVTFSGGTTDIRSALKRFRTAVAGERAEKQVYLITDTEPNCEDGKYVGFEKATLGVLQEALIYQREGITLNIIMLDSTPHLREFASVLAKRNLGRVFFAEPKDLGKVVIEDYLEDQEKGKTGREQSDAREPICVPDRLYLSLPRFSLLMGRSFARSDAPRPRGVVLCCLCASRR